MEPQFWQQKWKENKIAFHEREGNSLLSNNLHRLTLNHGARVFVPLCGKTLDLDWLFAQGCRVVGIELNQQAVEEVFDRMGTEPEISAAGHHRRYASRTTELIVGDFFDLSVEELGPVDAIFDRAALVALPPLMRKSYAARLTQLTKAAPQLLITYDYDQSKMEGPPFSVAGTEIAGLYGDAYKQELLSSIAVTGPLGERSGATENAWLLKPI